jgi:hypothetical protein
LSKGIEAPDGDIVHLTETVFYKIITDDVFIRKPQLVAEIIRNARIKIMQTNGRFIYMAFKPAGFVVTGEITYGAHVFHKNSASDVKAAIERAMKKGGKIPWEKS